MASPAYLNALGAALEMPTDAITPTGQSLAAAPYQHFDPLAAVPKPPPKFSNAAGYDPLSDKAAPANPIEAGVALGQQRGDIPLPPPPPPSPDVNAPIGPPAPPAAAADAGPGALLTKVSGGGIVPAHEVDVRGPSLRAAQGRTNEAVGAAAMNQEHRSLEQAGAEYATYLQQEREARLREQATQQSVAERDEELASRQADFDASVKNLSKMTIDRDRWFASRSTPQKVAAFLELGLAGFRGAPSMVMKRIDDDIKAQEFAYQVARDTADANKTAFGMAMQKYQNADAARAAVRAAALDSAQAQVAQLGALAKGTNAANHADTMLAALEEQKMQQIAQGVRFMPASMAQERYLDRSTGMVLTRAEALKRLDTLEGRDFDREKQLTGIGADLAKEGMKQHEKTDEGAAKIASALQGANVPTTRVLASRALNALNASEGGIGDTVARKALGPTAANLVMSEDSNAREQAYQDFANAAMKATMGNVTAQEEVRANLALGSPHDPASRRRAIASTMQVLEGIEKNAKAGASPAAQAEFDRRRASAESPNAMPKSFQGYGGKK